MPLEDDLSFQEGLSLSLSGDYDRAITCLLDTLGRYPDNPLAHYEVSVAYLRRGERNMPSSLRARGPSPSASSFGETVGELANSLVGLAILSASRATGQTEWIVRYRSDFREAVCHLTQAVEHDGEYALAYDALSVAYRYLGDMEQAAAASHKAAALEPENRRFQARSAEFDASARETAANERLPLTWDDLILPSRTKREIKQIQLLLTRPALARELGVDPPSGLLLYGPPGTGKTTVARVLAQQAGSRFIATSPAEVNSMWMGESEKQVARLFAQARANAPSIVFLDEIDALLPTRMGGINLYSDKVVNQFLHEMDGLVRNPGVFVIGATNRRDMLDPALLRGGRLSREIEIPLPDKLARAALFALMTRGTKLADDVDLDALVAQTEGMSGAGIKAIVSEAGLQALIRIAESPVPVEKCLTMPDFAEALANMPAPKPEPDQPVRWWQN